MHSKSTWSQVFASTNLYIEHVIEGNLFFSKKNCFLALPIYWSVRNFNIFVFCAFVIDGLDHNELDILILIFGFIVHLLMFGVRLPLFQDCFLSRI